MMGQTTRWCLVAWAILTAAMVGAEAPRTAVLDLTWAHAPGGFDPALADFSRGVQAQLLTDPDYAWIERQEFDRITAEVDLGRMSGGDALAAVRLGHWLRADLLLRGELTQGAEQAELKYEVIDLKRAEVLAVRAIAQPLNKNQRLHPSARDVAAAAAAAKQVLADARRQLEKATGLRVVAPLHFKGLGKSSRLGFLETRLSEALAKAAEAEGSVRVLRFPRTTDAGEEASLVVGGLTDATPEAAQQVADSYVWGTFEERDPGGVAFDDVPVTIRVQVWNGRGEPVAVEWSGQVKAAGAGLDDVAVRVIAAAKAPASEDKTDLQQRERMARQLGARAVEIGGMITPQADFLKSAAGRQLYALRLRLLETACFFDPLNRDLQEKRVRTAWNLDSPLQPLKNLRGWWLRAADLRTQAKNFTRGQDGTVDATWPELRTDALFEFIRNIENSERQQDFIHAGDIGYVKQRLRATFSPEDRHEQLRLTIGLWSDLVAETGRLVAEEKPEPAWLAPLQEKWVSQLQGIHFTTLDPVIFHSMYEKAWPALAKEVGHRMKLAAAGKRKPPELDLITIYSYFGEDTKVDTMLDQAWEFYQEPAAPPAPVVSPPPRAKTAAPTKKVRTDQPWAAAAPIVTSGSKPTVPPPITPPVFQPWAAAAATPIVASGSKPTVPPPTPPPALKATIRTIDFKPVLPYYRPQLFSEGGGLLQKRTQGRVEQIAWHAGRFWLAEEGAEIPKEMGATNPQGNHYLWSYDPVQHVTELITPQLGGHAALTALVTGGDGLWLGSAADGVWRMGAHTGDVKRFTDADGLASSRIHSCTRIGDDLFFVGGEYPDFVINRHSLKDGAWSVINVPTPKNMAKVAAEAKAQGATVQLQHAPSVARSGDWLYFQPWALFYRVSTKEWFDPRGLTGPMLPVGKLSAYYLGVVSADSSGFWCGTDGGFQGSATIRLVDLALATEPKGIRLPAVRLKALVHHGPWLWVLTESWERASALFLIDKRIHEVVGRVDLPALEASALWVTDDRLWVGAAANVGSATGDEKYGLPALLEISLAEARPSGTGAVDQPSGTLPLLAAVHYEKAAAFEQALAAGDINQASAAGWTALMEAVDKGRADWVQRLLVAGAEPNRISTQGESALSLALRQRDAAIVEILLKHGADATLRPQAQLFNLTPTHNLPESSVRGRLETVPPAQPKNLHASINDNGFLQLFWDDRAANETGYEVGYNDGKKWRTVAVLGPNIMTWLDPEVRGDAFHYRIEAVISTGSSRSGATNQPEVRGARAALATTSRSFMYGLIPGSTGWLPARFVVPPPLSIATAQGDESSVGLLLSRRADPNQPDAAGTQPLLHALRNRQYSTARQLLAAGARPDTEGLTGETPAGVVYGWHEDRGMIEALLQAMTPEIRAKEATDLIRLAASRGQIADITWLQTQGGYLRDGGGDHSTALFRALAFGQDETAAWLWRQMPSLQARWRSGKLDFSDEGIIEQALRWQSLEFFEAIFKTGCSPDLNVRGTPLAALAAKGKAFAVLDLLRKNKADLGAAKVVAFLAPEEAARYRDEAATTKAESKRPPNKTYFGQSVVRYTGPPTYAYPNDPAKQAANEALLAASARGDLPAVMRAVTEGAQLEATNPKGSTSLIEAVNARSLPVVRWLVEEGAHVDHISEKEACSPLYYAVQAGNHKVVEYLLAARADVNRKGYWGAAPLALALIKNDVPLVTRLLESGANPELSRWYNERTNQMVSPLAWAAGIGREDLFDLLLSHGANPKAQFYDYLTTDDDIVRRAKTSTLMLATLGKKVSLLKKLIALGQDPRFKTSEGYDALAWAAGIGEREVVEYLLPLSERRGRAIENARSKGHAEIVAILEQAGYQSP
jgi:ankyrin repeat protein